MDASTLRVKFFLKFLHFGRFVIGMPMKIDNRVKILYYTFALLFHSFLILGSVVTIVNNSKYLYKVEGCIRLYLSIGIAVYYVYFRVDKHLWVNLFAKCDKNSPHYVGDEVMKVTAKIFLQLFKIQWFCFTMTSVVCAAVAGVFLKNSREIDSYEFLYLYACGSDDTQPRIKYCFSRKSLAHFIVNDVMESAFIFYQSFIVQTAQLLLIAMFKGGEAKLKVYDDYLASCIKRIKLMSRSDRNDLVEFAAVVKLQQSIFKYNEPIISISDMANTMHVIFIYVMVLATVLAIGSQKFASMYLNVRFTSAAIYVLIVHYTYCKSVFVVGYAHEHFCEALLDIPWYERSIEFQKNYLTTLALCQKNYPFTMYGLYEMNMKFFAANVNRMYSIINLILVKYK